MTNWPNIQEYRNFEAKFFENHNDLKANAKSSAQDAKIESVIQEQLECTGEVKTEEFKILSPKRVRCVIQKDYDDGFKKFDRGDGLVVSQDQNCPKEQQTTLMTNSDQSTVDKVRLQNHLKWKKQKEEEFLRKKEAEKEAQQKRKETEIKMEKIKKLKEKEKVQKLREWHEIKEKEKEEKKIEKMVMKVLEDELKEVTPVLDKEKLIEDWVRMKDRQKQVEAEKRAVITKQEEENRVLRQNLAAISYRQWKEKLRGKSVTLPKNGYQIFGPKPKPVVKEDWNHDFTSNSPRQRTLGLFSSKSNTTTSFSFQTGVKELENLSKDMFYLGDIKTRSPSFHRLKNCKSGIDLCNEKDSVPKAGRINRGNLKENSIAKTKAGCTEGLLDVQMPDFSREPSAFGKNFGEYDNIPDSLLYLPVNDDHQNRCFLPANKKAITRQGAEPLGTDKMPIKKKIDLYINPPIGSIDRNFKFKCTTRSVINDSKPMRSKNPTGNDLHSSESKGKIIMKKSSTKIGKNPELFKISCDVEAVHEESNLTKEKITAFQAQNVNKNNKISCRSRSCDKSVKKNFSKESLKAKGCTSSKSLIKVSCNEEEERRGSLADKIKGNPIQRRRIRRQTKSNTADNLPEQNENEAGDQENGAKSKKKLKKKNMGLLKSLSFTDSPYCAKKSEKIFVRKKNLKNCET